MHTREIGKTTFHFNSDLSGDVLVVSKEGAHGMEIPAKDLRQFIIERLMFEAGIEDNTNVKLQFVVELPHERLIP